MSMPSRPTPSIGFITTKGTLSYTIINLENPIIASGICAASRMRDYVNVINLLFGREGSNNEKLVMWEG